jgi:ectoine hydroxylase-related dioxygenase (phytanoyl-CoA dioxygenase family)
MSLSDSQLEQYRRDGYIIVPDVFSVAKMDAALAEMDDVFYGKSFDDWLADFAANAAVDVSDGFTLNHDNEQTARAQFPTGRAPLDRLIEDDAYLDMFEQCLGDKGSYCNAHLFLRTGATDSRHSEYDWQGYHIDHFTNTLLPPSHETGRFDYVNSGVYLHDVAEDGAPMMVVPGSHKDAQRIFLEAIAGGNGGRGNIDDIRKVKDIAPAVPAVGKKGSALFYSSYLLHAAQPFRNKCVQRAFWTLSMCRRDNDRWTRFTTPLNQEREIALPFFTRTTARVRSILGFPELDHPYYTAESKELLRKMNPGIDVS